MKSETRRWTILIFLSFIILGSGVFFILYLVNSGNSFFIDASQIYWIAAAIFLIWVSIISIYIFSSSLKEKIILSENNEEMFRNVFNFNSNAIIITDLECHILKWNKVSEDLFGYSETEVVGHPIGEFIPTEKECNISEILGHIWEVEIKNKNEKTFVAEISATSIRLKNGNFTSFIIRDISERKKIEGSLAAKASELDNSQKAIINVLEDVEKEKAQSEALLSGIGDAVVALDNNFNIIFINKVFEEQFGWNSGELIGNNFYSLIKAENNKGELLGEEERPFYLSLKSGNKVTTSVSNPYYFIKKDGTKFPAATTVTPVKVKDIVIGAIGVYRDIAHEIEVDKMKSEFVSLVSHQLRTPLSAMRWYAEMLLNGDAGKLTDDQTDFIENIYKSNERMINLVNSLLNISRIESGRIIIEPKPTDLKGLIDEVMSEVKVKFDEKQQTVLISVHPDLGPINLDPKLIFQVYKNLLTNANKYTPDHGQIEIFVSKKGDDVVSRVTDNGYGISKKDQPKIFEKFHRAENILKLETDGTGLGLYLAKAIVESSGGQIGFESEENKGTTFWFSLPIKGVAPQKGEVSLTN